MNQLVDDTSRCLVRFWGAWFRRNIRQQNRRSKISGLAQTIIDALFLTKLCVSTVSCLYDLAYVRWVLRRDAAILTKTLDTGESALGGWCSRAIEPQSNRSLTTTCTSTISGPTSEGFGSLRDDH